MDTAAEGQRPCSSTPIFRTAHRSNFVPSSHITPQQKGPTPIFAPLGQTWQGLDSVLLNVKFPVWPFLTTAFLLALGGCGGGGGGTDGGKDSAEVAAWRDGGCSLSTASTTMNYRALWPASAPATASVVVQLLNNTGTVLRTEVVNRSSTSEITVSGLPSGVFEVRGELFTAANGTGSSLGRFKRVVDLCSAPSYILESSASDPSAAPLEPSRAPSRLAVFPSQVNMLSNQTVRFVGQLLDSSSRPVFTANSPTYSVSGPAGITSGGLLTPVAAGTALVTSSQNGLSGTGSASISAFNATKTKWTVLVYMNAANDLYSASTLNMNQMEKVAGNSDVRFVVQWKQSKSAFSGSTFDGTRRYLVKHDTTSQVVSTLLQDGMVGDSGQPLDMGAAKSLKDFVAWGKANFPSDRTVLVLWNHGNGWRRSPEEEAGRAWSYDDQYGTSIKTWETDDALAGQTFDIVAWDCSLMQMMEVAHEFRGIASYMAGSEESPPADGYPYDAVFAGFASNPDASTVALSKGFVDGMLNHSPYANRKITQSVLDISKLNALTASLDTFADSMIAEGAGLHDEIQTGRSQAQSFSPTALRYYRDIISFCSVLEAQPGTPAAVKSASADVRAKVAAALVWEGHNSFSSGSRGLSIDLSPGSVYSGMAGDYQRLSFAQASRWDSFLASSPD